jgi:hypothetical protein
MKGLDRGKQIPQKQKAPAGLLELPYRRRNITQAILYADEYILSRENREKILVGPARIREIPSWEKRGGNRDGRRGRSGGLTATFVPFRSLTL